MADHDHELAIISDSGRTDYEFEAVGFVYDVRLNDHDEIGDKTVSGHVNGGKDVIGFNAAPKGIAFGDEIGDYRLELDGEPVDPFHLNMRTIRIETSANKAPYRFAVDADGLIIGGQWTNETEIIHESGTSARGRVAQSGHDEWYFAGVLTGWPDSNQPLKVTVDGRTIEYDGNPPNGVV